MRSVDSRFGLRVVTVLVAASFVTAGCKPDEPDSQPLVPDGQAVDSATGVSKSQLAAWKEHPQCTDPLSFPVPGDDQKLFDQTAAIVESRHEAVFAIGGKYPVTRANEAHDCQGIIRNGTEYDGILTAWLVDTPSVAGYQAGVHVGTLVYGGKNPILNLNISRPRSCLMVQGEDANEKDWKAWIVDPGPNNVCEMGDVSGVTALNVWRSPSDNADDPISLRIIDENPAYYIAVQCRKKWCVVGVPEQGKKPANYKSPKNAKGDRQRLSIVDTVRKTITPSTLIGTIMPVANLRALNRQPNQFKLGYVKVATISFEGGTLAERQTYMSKYGITEAELMNGVDVSIMEDSAGAWHFKYDNTVSPHKIETMAPGALIHGTSRWRWSDKDEGVWIHCPAGCCGDDG